MDQHASAATAMLGLPGFVLLAVSAHDGEVEQAIETAKTEDFCRGCGVVAQLHDLAHPGYGTCPRPVGR